MLPPRAEANRLLCVILVALKALPVTKPKARRESFGAFGLIRPLLVGFGHALTAYLARAVPFAILTCRGGVAVYGRKVV